MVSPIRQRGLSGLSLLMVLLLIGFFATVFVKLLPIYMSSWTVKSVLTSIVEEGGTGMTPAEIRKKIDRSFNMNQVTVITTKDIDIKREKSGKVKINANYEQRVPFMQNVDVVVKFEKLQFEVQGK